MSVSSVTELVAGKVYALHNTFELNGKISAYPEKARGFSPANCYLLIDEKAAMLLDTGYTAHEGAILEQLDSLLDREMPLSIFPLRINEFMSVCNTMAIAKRFNVVECFSNVPNIEEWVEFETLRGEERNPILKTTLLGRGEQSQVFLGEKRKINVLTAPIRLISTRWIYDESSKILFSSDILNRGKETGDYNTDSFFEDQEGPVKYLLDNFFPLRIDLKSSFFERLIILLFIKQ